MKREYNSNNIPDNCIFYTPLTNGDLTDLVSGSVMQQVFSTYPLPTWDSTENAYKFIQSFVNDEYLLFDNLNLPIDTTKTQLQEPVTCTCDIKINVSSNANYQYDVAQIGVSWVNDTHGCYPLNSWFRLGGLMNTSTSKKETYKNGVLKFSTTSGINNVWSSNTQVRILKKVSWTPNATIWMKNLIIYKGCHPEFI